MHFNKLNSSDNNNNNNNNGNNMNLLNASSSALTTASPLSSSTTASAAAAKTKSLSHGLSFGIWGLLLLTVVLMAQQQPCECRYLPTRSHGDDLDKLRELMLQVSFILFSLHRTLQHHQQMQHNVKRVRIK